MDYEKAYNAVLKTAKQWVKDGCTDKEKICLEAVFPELRESEDEKIRGFLYEFIKICAWSEKQYPPRKKCLTYLEKQKDANKEYWRGYREGKQEILDKYAEIKRQKEQKTEPFSCGHENGSSEKPNNQWSEDFDTMFDEFCDKHPDGLTLEECGKFFYEKGKEFRQEWSEEDEHYFQNLIMAVDSTFSEGNTKNWLQNRFKSLRPQPHWKPSEEMINSLETVIKGCGNCTVGSIGYHLKELYEHLISKN